MIIVYDLNRTLFNPETNTLMEGAYELLTHHTSIGAVLHLVSKKEIGRDALPKELGIDTFFSGIHFVKDKEEILKTLIEGALEPVYIIGDHLHGEIRYGNRYGAKTIWIQKGKFSSLTPEHHDDVPWMSVSDIREIAEITLD